MAPSASEAAMLGTALVGLIFDPSIFHGYSDPLEPYIDGIRSRGTNPCAGRRVRRDRGQLHAGPADPVHLALPPGPSAAKAQGDRPRRRDPRHGRGVVERDGQRRDSPQGPHLVAAAGLAAMGPAPPGGFASQAAGKRRRISTAFGPPRQGQAVGLSRPESSGSIVWDAGSPQCREEIPGFQQLYQGVRRQGPRDPRLQLLRTTGGLPAPSCGPTA